MQKGKHGKKNKLPDFFEPILWSYDFQKIDPENSKKQIIVNAINYGSLRHWRWLAEHYGKKAVREVLESIPASELRPRSGELSRILFSVRKFNYAPRGYPR